MIVVVSGSLRAQECAAAIERRTHQKTVVVASLDASVGGPRHEDCQAMVIDESLQQGGVWLSSVIAAWAESALPIYVNLSLHGAERVAQEVSLGLQRLAVERAAAMRVAANRLQSELRGEVTAILLTTDLALREHLSEPGVSEKLRAVRESAEQMRRKLEGASEGPKRPVLRPRLVSKEPRPVSTQ